MQQQVITTTTLRQPAVQIQESSESRIHHKYGSQTSLVLGALQVVIGLLCIFFNLAAILLGATHGRVCHGFWCGTIVRKIYIFSAKRSSLVWKIESVHRASIRHMVSENSTLGVKILMLFYFEGMSLSLRFKLVDGIYVLDYNGRGRTGSWL